MARFFVEPKASTLQYLVVMRPQVSFHCFKALVLVGLAAGAQTAFSTQEFKWRSSLSNAKAEARQTKLPLLLYFTTDWCGYCKVMEKETFPKPEVQKQAAKYIAVKLDAEKEGKTSAAKHKVNSYPTFVMVDANDKEIGRITGYKATADYMTRIDQILTGKAEIGRLTDRITANPKDGEAHLSLAIFMLGEGELAKAEAHAASAKQTSYKGPLEAKVNLEFGKLYVKSNYAKAADYLNAALALKEKTVQSEAYENLMMACLYGGKSEEALVTAKRMSEDSLASTEVAAKGKNFLRHHELGLKTATPDDLVTHLIGQLQGVSGTRDRFDFEGLFLDGAYTKIVMVSPKFGVMTADADKATWHKTLGYDNLKTKLIERNRKIDMRDNIATVWLELDYVSTLPDGKEMTGRSSYTLVLMKSGQRWLISSMIHQSVKVPE